MIFLARSFLLFANNGIFQQLTLRRLRLFAKFLFFLRHKSFMVELLEMKLLQTSILGYATPLADCCPALIAGFDVVVFYTEIEIHRVPFFAYSSLFLAENSPSN